MPSHTAEPEVEVGLEIGRENCGKIREYVGKMQVWETMGCSEKYVCV